ncbi:MAG: ankyrin repeat domain-containing protein [Pseudomonadota bacterium]
MAKRLPKSPDLAHLKKQAKALARSADIKLSEAQLGLARDYGFASWPKLKQAVDEQRPFTIDDFLKAATGRRLDLAEAMLKRRPDLASATLQTAAVLGDVPALQRFLADDPAAATRPDGPLDWPPLMYLCWSVFLKADRDRPFEAATRWLMDAGADPNAFCAERSDPPNRRWSALYGAAGEAGHAGVTKLLLKAGADPDDNESLYHAAEQRDTACLALLLDAGATIKGTNALFRKLDFEDPAGLQLFFDHGADPNHPIYRDEGPQPGTNALFHAIRRGRSAAVIAMLLEHGVDTDQRDADGLTAYAQAYRAGSAEIAELLADRGASTSLTPVDHLIGACSRGAVDEVSLTLKAEPNLADRLSPSEARILVEAAFRGQADAVGLLLDAGIDIETRGDTDGTALHHASNRGYPDVVALLIERGADIEAVSAMTDSGPLGWAIYGARYEPNRDGDYEGVVRHLLAAGATVEDWMDEMATDALWDVMRGYQR